MAILDEYGYKPDGRELPPEYLVRVTSLRNRVTIKSPLQEDIHLKVNSQWVPLLPHNLLTTANLLVQATTLGRRSFITKATTRRIWTGSSPMRLSLKMRFEAVEDEIKEVAFPLYYLSAMALPSQRNLTEKEMNASVNGSLGLKIGGLIGKGLKKLSEKAEDIATLGGIIPLLCPPGPSPFSTQTILDLRAASSVLPTVVVEAGTSIFDSLVGGDKIMIELGDFITFYNVIIQEVNSTVPIKFAPSGWPISATVNVGFETYEMMTVEDLRNCFDKKTSDWEITAGQIGYDPTGTMYKG